MIDALYIAESGLNSQQKMIDVISNNIANANTPSFKKNRVSFVDLVYQDANSSEVGFSDLSANTLVGAGSAIASTTKVFTNGDLKRTDNNLDIAISGNGFFEVSMPNGEKAYTRASRMRLDADGNLSTSEGYTLTTNIQVSPDVERLEIKQNGEVFGYIANSTDVLNLGQIELTRFTNQEQLLAMGANLYKQTEGSGDAIYGAPGDQGFGMVMQGFSEGSNVSTTAEMVDLVLAQRGYQLNARIIQTADAITETLINMKR